MAVQMITIEMANPLSGVSVLNNYQPEAGAEELMSQQTVLNEICLSLQGLMSKLEDFYNRSLSEHKEKIARLSVEIARKILVQEIKDDDYKIETIIKEALSNAPSHDALVVHLNPSDFSLFEQAQKNDSTGSLATLKVVSDPKVGKAEYVLETSKGTIEYFINEHLEQIGKALEKAE